MRLLRRTTLAQQERGLRELRRMKISVITPCLNRAGFIAEAIESVVAQNYPQLEHWIIDGGSTDGSLEIAGRYSHLKVISEPDRGVYDAINKGLNLATGDIIALLNTDDLFVPGAFRLCEELFRNGVGTMIVSGGCQIFRRTANGQEIEMHRYENARRYQLSLRNVTVGLPLINGRLFRRSVFERIGTFDLEYPIAADRDFLIRAALAGIPDAPVSRVLYRYRWHAGSLTINAGNSTMLCAIEDGIQIIKKTKRLYSLGRFEAKIFRQWERELRTTKVLTETVMRKRAAALSSAGAALLSDPMWLFTLVRCGSLAVGRRIRTWLRIWNQR